MKKTYVFLLMIVMLLGQSTAQAELADITAPGDIVRGVPNDGDWPAAESPPLAIDNNINTKYLHFKGDFNPDVGPTGFQVTPSIPQSIVTGLTFTTANDAPERDPVAFALYGSNTSIDGPYTLIASGDIVDFKQATAWPRLTKNTTPITFHNKTAYNHYQLLFTAIRDRANANSMQIAEVEFLGSPAGGLPPEVDAGGNQTITWKGVGNTSIRLYPTIYDDDPCNIGQTDPNYLKILWSCLGQTSVDFRSTQTKANAEVLFPAPGVYELLLQVCDERGQEGNDSIVITVVVPQCPLSDLSGDCKVNSVDLLIFAEQWLDNPGCPGYSQGCADLAGNDGVNLIDFALLAEDWLEDWTGSLRVTIYPAEAVAAGAKWRLDGGAWRDSGEFVNDLTPGDHTTEFNILGSWIRPPSKIVQIQKSQITTIGGTYARIPDSSLLINEIMAVNESTYPTNVEGKQVFSDWIEIYNAGPKAINLKGWHLTDEENELTKWPLPDVSVQSDSYLVVYASGIEEVDHPGNYPYRDGMGRYHTNFQLDGKGEYLALVDPNGKVSHEYKEYMYDRDRYGYPPQERDISYGLYASESQFFTNPTPGKANSQGFSGISESPRFSHSSGTFTQPFSLLLSAPAGAQIRYTLDGSKPTEVSKLYTGSIPISGTVEVMASAYEAGKAPSPVAGSTYIALDSSVQGFNSNLPIVIVDTKSQGIGTGTYTRVSSVFIDTNVDGRARITDSADFAGRGGIRIRGRSTAGQPKRSYNFEVWDEDSLDKDVSIFGLPAESDWILYAPYSYDRVLINNAFMFELSNQIGRYAVRTRFVEMYLNTGSGKIAADDYVGIYIFEEKIKRGADRVDVEKIEPWDSTEPRITGGYMLKIDSPDPGDSGFHTSRGNPTYGDGTLCYVDPKEAEITAAQSSWIRGYLDDFEDALYGPDFTNPEMGYARFIDVDSWIDHNLLNMLAKNVDALRLSTHIHKTRNGKLEMGPIWDFDRSLESADGRDDNPQTWRGTGDATDYLNYIWWDRLFKDIDFWQKYIDQWTELRRGQFSTTHINAIIDSMAKELAEAQVRNLQKWPGVGPRFGSFQGDIDHLKNWLVTRTTWVDAQFVRPPIFTPGQGYIQAGSTLSMNNPGTGKMYYTLDGSDPRVFGAFGPVEVFTLMDESASKRVLVPTSPVDEAWKGGAEPFDDSGWNSSTFISDKAGGVGYDESPDFVPYITYDVAHSMNRDLNVNANTTCYIRIVFNVTEDQLSNISALRLRMRYDDGYIVYLNGKDNVVARSVNAPSNPDWHSSASSNIEITAFEDIDISAHINKLKVGKNILAIQGLNSSTTSPDFLISVVLDASKDSNPNGNGQKAGDVSVSAIEYKGQPITLNETTRVKARVLASGNTYSPWSGRTEATFAVGPVQANLRITEIMFHPANDPDPCSTFNDDDFEFIELKNIGGESIDLHWVSFTEGIHYTFPKLILDPGGFVVVVKNPAAFATQYDTSKINIAPGVYSGNLSNAGERIRLEDALSQTILDFQYKDDWYDITDGTGFSLTIKDPVAADPNAYSDKAVWRPSAGIGGSPGYDDSNEVPELGSIVINEIMAHSHAYEPDWIELYNTTNKPINIGGWFLSDDQNNLTKYQIAQGTVIGAYGYKLFYEDQNFGNLNDQGCKVPFALSENGETLCLQSGSNGVITGFSEQEKFDASATGVSLGRYLKSTGAYNFVALSKTTPGIANAYPLVGPVVINEIMYHPDVVDDAEYVELLNMSGGPVTLYDANDGVNEAWRFTDDPDNPGIDFRFAKDSPVTLNAGEYLLLVKDITLFSSKYTVPQGVKVYSWGAGKLDNAGEKIQISKPGDIDLQGTRHWIRVDRVVYSDGAHPDNETGAVDPWPTDADGLGKSLSRKYTDRYGNDPNNWRAATPSPGKANP